jgi:two-component system OmpR family response regulator
MADERAPLRVLVVDDNIDSAETLCELLPLWGHEARVAHDGPAAITILQEFQPDVVLLDIGLPGMDGFEVARRIRASGTKVGRLLAMTGYSDDEDRRKAREAGFDGHLVKPVDPDSLQKTLAEAAAAVSR